MKLQKKQWSGVRDQGGFEQKTEVIVKMKRKIRRGWGIRVWSGGGGGLRVDLNQELKLL